MALAIIDGYRGNILHLKSYQVGNKTIDNIHDLTEDEKEIILNLKQAPHGSIIAASISLLGHQLPN